MRKRNSVCEFKDERNLLLLTNFRKAIARQSQISLQRALCEAVESPAPRFWVSESRAAVVISMMMRGLDPLKGMREEKKEMYEEIYRRFLKLREREPGAPAGDLVFRIINGDTPKFYITWRTAKRLIYENR